MAIPTRIARCLLVVVCFGPAALAAAPPAEGGAAGLTEPALVSPGGRGHEGRVGSGCPTFSWTVSPAVGYQLVVYEVGEVDGDRKPAEMPVLYQRLPAGATSWTPELDACLPPGRYGWAIGAIVATRDGESWRWSRPAVFRVEEVESPRGTRAPQPRGMPSRVAAAAAPSGMPASAVTLAAPIDVAGPRPLTEEAFTPGACTAGGELFTDVPATDPFCQWIEQIARAGIAGECSTGHFCPDNPVTRRQLASYLGKSMFGTATWHPAQGTNLLAPPVNNRLTEVENLGDVGEYTSITIGADGLPIISYRDVTAGTLKVAHCNDVACAGENETITTVDDPANNVGHFTSITIGADGLPIISYFDDSADALKVAHCNDVACAGQDETITTVDNPANDVGFYTSITIGADGLPIISYQDFTVFALKVAHCNDVACAGLDETITTVDDSANLLGDYTSITIGADGLPIISYRDGTAGALKVAHCNDVACAGQNETITTVDDPANNVGYFTSITIGADGLPIISYHDDIADALKVAHCNDVACAGYDETITTVDDPANNVGSHTSITIGADGLPIISYYDDSADALKVAHCNDVECAGENETMTTVADTANYVGSFTSITIGADGLPIISYYDSTAGALDVAHCANVFCTPYFRRR